jgi:hypothetical protein
MLKSQTLNDRLGGIPPHQWFTLKEIANMIGNKPHTSLKQRIMLDDRFTIRQALVNDSPIPNIWRWEYQRIAG